MSVPSNWLFSTNSFARHYSDPKGEGVSIYSPVGQNVYSTKTRNLTPIKITCDSNSVSFILQKLIIAMDVTALNNGTPVTGAKNTYLGLESIIQSLTVKAAGETVVKIDNYPLYCAQEYKNMNVGNKKLLQQMTGYGNVDVFQTNSTVSTNFHPVIGFFHPENSGFFPVWALPNQSLELVIVLSDPSTVFTDGLVNELQVSNVRVILPYITPPPQVVINATRAIADGKSIFYDYTRSTQTENASSGGLRNTYQLHMSGVRSLAGFTASFIDDDVLADPSKDKALAFGSQNLREWRMSLGPNLTIPSGVQGFTHSPTDKTTLLVTQLSMNDFTQLGDLDISFADYDAKQFSFGYGFQSKDESSHAALSFEGTDSIMRIHTIHSAPVNTKVRLVTTYFENVTLSIGPTVSVI
nr:TPA_asm: hexon [Powellomyces chytrid fungus MELD virus 5]